MDAQRVYTKAGQSTSQGWLLVRTVLTRWAAQKSFLSKSHKPTGLVRFVEKTSRNIIPTDLLWEKNIVSTKKQAEKDEL